MVVNLYIIQGDTRRTHLAVRLRTLPLWPGSGVLSSGETRKSARLVALASFDPPAAAAVPLRQGRRKPSATEQPTMTLSRPMFPPRAGHQPLPTGKTDILAFPPPARQKSMFELYPLPFFDRDRSGGQRCWAVKPSGDYGLDCATGRAYAADLITSCDGSYGWAAMLAPIRDGDDRGRRSERDRGRLHVGNRHRSGHELRGVELMSISKQATRPARAFKPCGSRLVRSRFKQAPTAAPEVFANAGETPWPVLPPSIELHMDPAPVLGGI